MLVRYERFAQPGTFQRFVDAVLAVASRPDVRRVCDIGGGANPRLSLECIRELGLDYTVLDISEAELSKAPPGYCKVHADIADANLGIENQFDFVVSRMVAEHVSNARVFHRNVFAMLAPGGTAIHIFPTLFTLPFTVNKLLPEPLSEKILLALKPYRTRDGKVGKFPARYEWCYGPTR